MFHSDVENLRLFGNQESSCPVGSWHIRLRRKIGGSGIWGLFKDEGKRELFRWAEDLSLRVPFCAEPRRKKRSKEEEEVRGSL